MAATAKPISTRTLQRRYRAWNRCEVAARKLGGAVDTTWHEKGWAQVVFAQGRDEATGMASPAVKIIDGATLQAVEQVAVALEAAAIMQRGKEDR